MTGPKPVPRQGRNPVLLAAVAFTVALRFAAIYHPFLQQILHTSVLTRGELAVCLTLPWVVLVAMEMEKFAVRREWIYRACDRARTRSDVQ